MQPRTISSSFTFLYKVVLPLFWVVIVFPAVVSLFLGTMRGQNDQPPPEAVKWIALALFIGMMTFFVLIPGRLKRVRVGDDALYVSNYIREITLPFTTISDVKISRYIRGNPVTISFRDPTLFGNKIMFMPRAQFNMRDLNKPHPIVGELKKLAKLPDA